MGDSIGTPTRVADQEPEPLAHVVALGGSDGLADQVADGLADQGTHRERERANTGTNRRATARRFQGSDCGAHSEGDKGAAMIGDKVVRDELGRVYDCPRWNAQPGPFDQFI